MSSLTSVTFCTKATAWSVNERQQNGDQVNDVERAAKEPTAVRRRPEPQQILDGEPADAGRLEVDEVIVVFRVSVLVPALQRRESVEGEADGRRDDEKN